MSFRTRHAGLVPASTAPQAKRPVRVRDGGPRHKAGVTAVGAALALSGCVVAPVSVERAAPVAVAPAPVPAGMQYLYGSGEAAALSEQAFRALTTHVLGVLGTMRDPRGRLPSQGGRGRDASWYQVVLAPGATAAMPTPLPCGTLPPAVVLDMDETTVLNLGYEYNDARRQAAYDPARWAAWEATGADKVVAVPGARAAFDRLRLEGVTIVINSNRSAASADATERALSGAGLGSFRHGETLFLKGDADGRSGKDGRRAAIATRYCVVAMVGDQLGDFADFLNPPGPAPAPGRRALATTAPLSALWGNGWFVLPNPVYGTGLGTGWDETFPLDRRWSPQP